ncbi:hypothetical protein [Caballeronia humi]|uniref:Lipoprotein n=1 Tax=Caballeronia humi TaxID=326474 RepID=A0A158G6N3_9BURK|nr:hypothetical protein [Caballeronia humi]SAL27299.1 hypothetical protein AWB65_01587 [Caballeronia humi]
MRSRSRTSKATTGLLTAALVLPMQASYAADWAMLAKSNESLVYFDLSTYRRTGTVRTGWTRETFFRPVTIPGTRKRGDMRDVRFVIDCSTGSKSDGETNFYLQGVWLDHGWGTPDVFNVPPNGSVDQLLVTKLCR